MAAVERTSELLERARSLRRENKLDEAAKLYREALDRQPRDFDALYELGAVYLGRGRLEESLRLLENAARLRPNSIDALLARSNTLFAMKRYSEAVTSFDEALKLKPTSAEAHNNRGGALGALGRHAEALESFDKAVQLKPEYADAHKNRGTALRALRRYEEASASYDKASVLRPNDPAVLVDQAEALRALKRHKQALACLDRALAIDANLPEAHLRRAETLETLNRYDDALESVDKALALDPQSARLHGKSGILLRQMGRLEDALASFDKALAIDPKLDGALIGKAQTLLALGLVEQAVENYDSALAVKSDSVDALVGRGFALCRVNRYEEAAECYRLALRFQPECVEARGNLALLQLTLGDLPAGWEGFEWRWKDPKRRMVLRKFAQPRWLGQAPLAGKTILLYNEQGFGDTLQMVRYVPLLAEQGARVIVQVQAPLVPLLQGLPGAERVIGPRDALPPFDLYSPLMSLPLAFGTTLQTIPNRIPYVSASPERVAAWTERLGKATAPRIGIAWSGNAKHGNDRNRSIALKDLLPLLSAGAEVVSIQKDVRETDRDVLRAHPQIRDFADDLKDFSDSGALVSLLDLVVSVDTAPVHLAGALGKPVWVLVPFAPDWRWLLDREDNPWYPTARLFRQPAFGDWDSVIRRVLVELRNMFPTAENHHDRAQITGASQHQT